MSEVEKAMEEVVDAVVATSTPEQEESSAQVRSSPAKDHSNKESQDEGAASIEKAQLSDNVPADDTVKPKRTSKERKEGAKVLKEPAAAAASDDSQTQHTDAQGKGQAIFEVAPMSLEPGVASPDEPARKRKLNSKKRRSLRAREAAAAATGEPTVSEPTTTDPSAGSDSPKSITEPPLPARTKKVAVKAEGATQQSRTSEDATAAKVAVQDTAKTTERGPKIATTAVKTEPVPATSANTTAPAKEASKTKATSKAAVLAVAAAEAPAPTAGPSTGTTTPQETKPTKLRPAALKPDQLIAVHALLALLQQQVFADATLVTANSGALKSHLLHGIAKLGYTCLEGTAESFQRVAWHAADNYLDYSPPIVKAPEQFVQSSKTKGDLKLAAPALFVQLRAYPDFGALSPLLQGMKAFKSGFTRSVDEVAAGESDAFVFAAPQKVYQQFALQAVPTMPALSDVAKYAKTFRLEVTNKDGAVCTLRCVASRVEKAMGDDYIVVAVLP